MINWILLYSVEIKRKNFTAVDFASALKLILQNVMIVHRRAMIVHQVLKFCFIKCINE